MSVVGGNSSGGGDSSSNFSDNSSWSSAMEISDGELEFDVPTQVAIHPPSSGPVVVSSVKSLPSVHPSHKRTVAGTYSLRQHNNQSTRHRSASPNKTPNRIIKPSAPNVPTGGGARGRPTARSVSPKRTSGARISVRVPQRPLSPIKKPNRLPQNQIRRSLPKGLTPIHFTPRIRTVSPPTQSSLPEDVNLTRYSSDGKSKPPKRRNPTPKPPKRISGKSGPALTPKITPKGSKKTKPSVSPKAPIRTKSDDLSPLTAPKKADHRRNRSMPLELLSRDEMMMETVNDDEATFMEEEKLQSKQRSRSLDREPSAMTLFLAQSSQTPKTSSTGSKPIEPPIPLPSRASKKPAKLRKQSRSPKPAKKPTRSDSNYLSPKKAVHTRAKSMPEELLTLEELVETVDSDDEETHVKEPPRLRSRSLDREPSAMTLFPTQFSPMQKRSSTGSNPVQPALPRANETASRSLSSPPGKRRKSPMKRAPKDGSSNINSETLRRGSDVPVGDINQSANRTSPKQERANSQLRSRSPRRTSSVPERFVQRKSLSPGPNARRKDFAPGAVTMLGLEAAATHFDSVHDTEGNDECRQRLRAKSPAKTNRYKVRTRQRSRRDRLIEFKRGSFCIGNKEIEMEIPPRSLVVIWVVLGIELFLDLIATAISFVSFLRDPIVCCEEEVEHDTLHLGITIPFIVIIVGEIGFLLRAIFLSLWPKSTYTMGGEVIIEDEEVASSDPNGIGKTLCCIDWSPTFIFWIVNLLTIINPYFGFFITWILMYQSDKNEALAVMGIEAVSILLHFIAVHLEQSAPTLKLKLMHMLAIVAWLATIFMTLYYLQQGGVCYNSEVNNFWFDGCEVCPDGSPPIDVDGLQCPYTTVILGRNYTAYEPVFGLTLKKSTICKDDLQMCWYTY